MSNDTQGAQGAQDAQGQNVEIPLTFEQQIELLNKQWNEAFTKQMELNANPEATRRQKSLAAMEIVKLEQKITQAEKAQEAHKKEQELHEAKNKKAALIPALVELVIANEAIQKSKTATPEERSAKYAELKAAIDYLQAEIVKTVTLYIPMGMTGNALEKATQTTTHGGYKEGSKNWLIWDGLDKGMTHAELLAAGYGDGTIRTIRPEWKKANGK